MNQPTPSKAGGSGVLGRLRQRGQSRDDIGADSDVDEVAGVPTRRDLVHELATAVQTSKNNSALAVLAFVQVGQLREINDVYGPDAGDAMLRLAASRLQTIDLPGTKVLRYEGAVLAVIFQNVPNVAGAEETARFLVELMAPPFMLGEDQITVGSNVGAAISTDNYEALEDMVYDAFQALGEATDNGLGAWQLHDETKRTRHTTRVDERRLHRAVENNEFLLHYQPILALATGEIVGVEALLRWTQPGATNVGMLFPHDFLPLRSASGCSKRRADRSRSGARCSPTAGVCSSAATSALASSSTRRSVTVCSARSRVHTCNRRSSASTSPKRRCASTASSAKPCGARCVLSRTPA
jgi:diguanylate cyclase (GGDEF)-like protein